MTRADELAAALAAVEDRLAAACVAAGRAREDVRLVAVTKFWPASDVALLAGLGLTDFGESRDQEASAKAAAVRGLLGREVRWHFVGRLQTNKAAGVAAYASVVQSLDRLPLATALARGAVRAGRHVEVLLQVSLDGDPDRGGALPADVPGLADAVAALPGLRLAGVMAVAPQGADAGAAFGRLAGVAAALRREHPQATAISAGMSGDLEQAIAHGATTVRVGTALLGVRPPLLR